MYSVFEELCNSRGVTPYKVSKETKIASSTFSDWKNGKSKPKSEKLQKIADFFGVSVDYLINGEEREFTKEQAQLDLKISKDLALKEAIKKYYALSAQKQKHVLELIDLLSEV